MHILSAAVLKGRDGPTNLRPRDGTKIRRLFDLFYTNKGKAVEVKYTQWGSPSQIEQLTDIYGLDIRRVGKCQYCLVGEWFGATYVDYLAP